MFWVMLVVVAGMMGGSETIKNIVSSQNQK